MNSRKKLKIALFSTIATVLVVVVGVVAVFAATLVSIDTSVRVEYTSHEVAANITGTYTYGGATTDMTVDGKADGAKKVTFTGEEAEDDSENVGSLKTQGDIELTSENRDVVFAFTFDANGGKAYTATITYQDSADEDVNVTVERSTDNKTWSAFVQTGEGKNNSMDVAAGNTASTYYVRVTITALKNDAEFSGSFKWVLDNVQ